MRAQGVKSLARERDQAELLARLKQVRPDSVRRWGRMSAHQMVCHLADAFRMALGHRGRDRALRPLPAHARQVDRSVRAAALAAGHHHAPELDQARRDATPPTDFAADLAEVEALLRLMIAETRQPRRCRTRSSGRCPTPPGCAGVTCTRTTTCASSAPEARRRQRPSSRSPPPSRNAASACSRPASASARSSWKAGSPRSASKAAAARERRGHASSPWRPRAAAARARARARRRRRAASPPGRWPPGRP